MRPKTSFRSFGELFLLSVSVAWLVILAGELYPARLIVNIAWRRCSDVIRGKGDLYAGKIDPTTEVR